MSLGPSSHEHLPLWLHGLPEELAERVRPLNPHLPDVDRRFVLYWMHNAVRIDENPALQLAIGIAHRLRRPLLVYLGLSERYPYASDRHHRFVLEGARDVVGQLRERGIPVAVHVERPGHRGPFLKTLTHQAVAMVTEEMPCPPVQQWMELLAETIPTPSFAVDTSCIVPMRLVGRGFDRAFAFRDATAKLREARVGRSWLEIAYVGSGEIEVPLPFEPVDLTGCELEELIATCEIDHTIAPVPHTRGGSSAGYERWTHFKHQTLPRYARDRNDPLLHASSRLSAYLHYGHVSPFRIAREALEQGGEGAEKFLDELLIWRELSYAFCFYHEDLETVAALPEWARETLNRHRSDPRPCLHTWESLARAKTDDPLWDAAQQSLVRHGELHNNVRMTWGKAITNWTRTPSEALSMVIDLNHRYALDGRGPASYGGLLWCLGQFDRPFQPEQPIFGTVRARPTEEHAQRLDVARFSHACQQTPFATSPSVAVIGAGVAGLMAARTMADHGLNVTVFDKGRRVGGRISTRRDADLGAWDHGAQYITFRDPRLRRAVESWEAAGILAPWHGRIVHWNAGEMTEREPETRRYVGRPGMNRLAQHLATDLQVHEATEIQRLVRHANGWQLWDKMGQDHGCFQRVLIAIPAPQAAALLPMLPTTQAALAQVQYRPCWAALLQFTRPLSLEWDAAFCDHPVLGWVACDSSKPDRQPQHACWIVHANHAWSEQHLEQPAADVSAAMLAAFSEVTRVTAPLAFEPVVHRWRYAYVQRALGQPCLMADDPSIVLCGDWCLGPRVENALLSGSAAAGRLLGRLCEPNK